MSKYIPPNLRNNNNNRNHSPLQIKPKPEEKLPSPDDFPQLIKSKNVTTPKQQTGWANIIKQTIDEEKKKQEEEMKIINQQNEAKKILEIRRQEQANEDKKLFIGPLKRLKPKKVQEDRDLDDIIRDENYCSDKVIKKEKDMVFPEYFEENINDNFDPGNTEIDETYEYN